MDNFIYIRFEIMLTWREFRGIVIAACTADFNHRSDIMIKDTFWALFSRNSEAIADATHCCLEQYVMVGIVPLKRLMAMKDKRWWYTLAKYEDIPIPPIICECRKKKMIMYTKVNPNAQYIIKPHDAQRGVGIKLRRGDNLPTCTKDFIVQKQLVDCNVSTTRHFRVVTLFDGSLFAIFSIQVRDKSSIVSNIANSHKYLCVRTMCNHLTLQSQRLLTSLVLHLQDVHRRKMPDILSVGWDVMMDCDSLSNAVNIYVLEGNIFHSATYPGNGMTAKYKHHVDRYLRKYKQKK